MPLNLKHQSGFTMIELLVVIVILGILSVIGLNSFMGTQVKARDAQRKSDLANLARALDMYYNDNGAYPDEGSGVDVGKIAPGGTAINWGDEFKNATGNAKYMLKTPQDPGQYKYVYSAPAGGASYILYAKLENNQDKSFSTRDCTGNACLYASTDCGVTVSAYCSYGLGSPNVTVEEDPVAE